MSARDHGLLHGEITGEILSAFYEIYNKLGHGFQEKVYAAAIHRALQDRGLLVQREVWVTVYLDGRPLSRHRMDMVVEKVVVVENKAAKTFPYDAAEQLENYLAATKLEVGLLLNYGKEARFKRYVFSNDR